MSFTILHLSSISNAFISTVDHLPCDIIRSLWLIQSCNIKLNNEKAKLDDILKQLQSKERGYDRETINEIVSIKNKIHYFNLEATQESKALYNQVITHQITLNSELQQLRSIGDKKTNTTQDEIEMENLRNKLIKHYNENPLISQREALKEQKLHKSSKEQRKVQGNKIKLVLKIPKDTIKSKQKENLKVVKKTKKKKKLPRPIVPEYIEPALPEPIVEDKNLYCFCKQPSFGDMIGCDNEESCPNGDWFHYKCVGLLNRVDALKFATGKQKWFCSDYCKNAVLGAEKKPNKKQKKKKRRNW